MNPAPTLKKVIRIPVAHNLFCALKQYSTCSMEIVQILPTPRIYARFPFYHLMNTEDLYAQLKLRLHARLSLRTEVHGLRLSNRNDLWYVGGGAFQEGTFSYVGRQAGGRQGMGTLFDLSADLNITPTTLSGLKSGSGELSICESRVENYQCRNKGLQEQL